STTLLYHVTFAINSIGHAHGTQPYITGDDSRNNFWFALLTFGEGWHNNHHAYQSSARTGFRPGEIDIGYAGLKLLRGLGLVWDLREPPATLVDNTLAPGRKIMEKVARELAEEVAAERPSYTPAPSPHDIAQRARAMFPDVPPEQVAVLAERVRRTWNPSCVLTGPPMRAPPGNGAGGPTSEEVTPRPEA
ncbi:MAG: acyl-CoA desaturase, partial [Gemmatimonadetes bacterium]|nr:acyl-CoA desaturase [Gemmatimonadota bacterium]